MKILYLDCGMGAAGDMLTAALYELLDENSKKNFLEQINTLGIKDVVVSAEKAEKCGIVGTKVKVSIGEAEEEVHLFDNAHDHVHHHVHTHQHRGMGEIKQIIDALPLSETVRHNAIEVYKLIAEAESYAHGVPVTDIHFHEVGTIDAIVDVTAVSLLIEKLNVKKVIASPIHVGSGNVRCAHGILPVPAPATAHILKEIPIYSGDIKGELCTPTGAALLKHFADSFGNMPVMKIKKIGYGMGKKDFPSANCVRAMLGENDDNEDEIVEFACNIDDMTPERIGFATECLFEAGALDVYTIAAGMKKSRPGIILCVMCKASLKDKMLHLIFKHTTTLGIRENIIRRHTLQRRMETIKTSFGDVRVKHSEGYGISREKYEYEDIAKIAREKCLSADDVIMMIEKDRK